MHGARRRRAAAPPGRGGAPARPGRRGLQRLPRRRRARTSAGCLDPLPAVLSSREWESIETGVDRARRAAEPRARRPLRPARPAAPRACCRRELVFGHAGFLRACDGIRLPGDQQLFTYAADIGRDADGPLRSCSPTARRRRRAAGYALENRTVISRVLPSLYRDAQVHRLAPFFRALRVALQAVAPPGVEDPRIVVLTPGPVERDRLRACGRWPRRSAIRSSRAPTSSCAATASGCASLGAARARPRDPAPRRRLVLRPARAASPTRSSARPGLVEAARRGAVSIVNTLGSSVLENPALIAFLPRIGKHLLGDAPRLAGVPTWWCGEERRAALRARATSTSSSLRPMSRAAGHARRAFGSELSQRRARRAARGASSTGPASGSGRSRSRWRARPTLTAERPRAAPQRAARVRRARAAARTS